MIYCIKCGSELRGAKSFCIVCGTQQDKGKKEIEAPSPLKKESKIKELDEGTCIKCGEETEKRCFFCNDFICRDHYNRMQPNKIPYGEMNELKTHKENRRINEGWRGFIINACSKCSGLKMGKYLTDIEEEKISTVDHCSWYKLDY